VLRGGSWLNDDLSVRSAVRNYDYPVGWLNFVGFRCVRSQ
jgi:formylglycine-generating enzyme required for sulfatase activity